MRNFNAQYDKEQVEDNKLVADLLLKGKERKRLKAEKEADKVARAKDLYEKARKIINDDKNNDLGIAAAAFVSIGGVLIFVSVMLNILIGIIACVTTYKLLDYILGQRAFIRTTKALEGVNEEIVRYEIRNELLVKVENDYIKSLQDKQNNIAKS